VSALGATYLISRGGGVARTTGGSTGVAVPWIDQTRKLPGRPPLWVNQGSLSAPRCTQANIGHGTASMQGATGSMAGGATLMNTSSSQCTLSGRAEVTILDANGISIPTKLARLRHDLFGMPRPPHYPLVSLRPGQHAVVPIFWFNLCDHPRPPARLWLTWQGTTVTVPIKSGVPRCDDQSSPSLLLVGHFQPQERPDPPMPRSLPLRVDITAPPTARPGQTITYLVTLTNYSRHPVTFDTTCPAYGQQLRTSRRSSWIRRAFVLNCATTPSIAPGKHATYAMRFTIPTTTEPGQNAILWQFEPIGTGNAGKATLKIT
jgi:uncharacterized repeat protein (TIGR01451 family)